MRRVERWCLERGEAGGAGAVPLGLWGSGCWSVFVDEPVTSGGASDLLVEFDHGRVTSISGCADHCNPFRAFMPKEDQHRLIQG